MKEYYYVYNKNGSSPSRKHENFESAIAEAKRLANYQVNQKFEILKCVGYVESKPVISEVLVEQSESDNEFPPGLQDIPLPTLPIGLNKWVYKGSSLTSVSPIHYAVGRYIDGEFVWSDSFFGKPQGSPYHYIVAVK
jgi:hypothetical protein